MQEAGIGETVKITVTVAGLESSQEQLERDQRAYLSERGWEHNCEHPDCCWRWEKDVRWLSGTEDKTKHYCLSLGEAVAMQMALDESGVDGVCCACGYHGQEETPCPAREDGIHCEHWWDGEADIGMGSDATVPDQD